ncbi:hypothetical protein B0I35DRAFT_421041 [Stachybotrys elegans]|uniref:Receptor L-domain domain-containing protein n=1 Tax=Stachybotrys elegans TaxID=80388 RepID=A0A8K0SV21_9HYPO|nr:hypothetical protein B0I35DRAFT_421041 [Stachybotrys elegans]
MRARGWLATTALLASAQIRAVRAQGCSSTTGFVIASPDDVDELADCSTVNGSISIRFADRPGDWDRATLDLGSIATLIGDLVIYPDYRHAETNVVASRLQTVRGAITIQNNDYTNTVQDIKVFFPALETVQENYAITGAINNFAVTQSSDVSTGGLFRVWDMDVEELSLGGFAEVEGDLSIDNNDSMDKLELANLRTAGSAFRIQNNAQLSSINLESLTSVEGDLTFSQNGALSQVNVPELEFASIIALSSNGRDASFSFPKLASLGGQNTSATSSFQDLAEVDMPVLDKVNGGLSFQSTSISRLILPRLRELNGSITVEDNDSLTTLGLPRLQQGGDIFISSNNQLRNITANGLTTAGTIQINGAGLTNLELFDLQEVTGDFKVRGADSMDCTWFDRHLRPVVRGIFSCVGSYEELAEERQPTTFGGPNAPPEEEGDEGEGQAPSDNQAEASSGGISTGAQIGIGIAVAVAVIILTVGAFFFIRRRRQQAAEAAPPPRDLEAKTMEDSSSAEGVYDGRRGSAMMGSDSNLLGSPTMMGTHTTIRAVPYEPSDLPPRLSLLNFGLSAGLGSKEGNKEEK